MSDPVDLNALLLRHFGFSEFRTGQEKVIRAVLDGDDVVAILPTGGGKSVCFQLPALILDGVTLVISPLISLMKDQVDGLIERKLPATFINSTLSQGEMDDRIQKMLQREYKIVYIAPERFKSSGFLQSIPPGLISLFAIDECHCISFWGHDFRPDYLKLRAAIRNVGNPRVMALTATATEEVRKDIVASLGLGCDGRKTPRVFVSGFARPNLTLSVDKVYDKYRKLNIIRANIKQHKTGIVYCSTRKSVESVSGAMIDFGIPIVPYHAGMPDKARTKAQNAFMSGQMDVAVATNAFGMGIDRADLRFVIHHDIPGSLEAYYQEAGRAGRDGKPSICKLLFSYDDIKTQEFFIEGANPSRGFISSVMMAMRKLCGNGPIRMTIQNITKKIGYRVNPIAVGTSLKILERAGWIRREHAGGERTYTTSIPDLSIKLSELGIDFDRMEKKRERDTNKLHQLANYADSKECRHLEILNYFGEEQDIDSCNACDNCTGTSAG